ncbi:unnamed protein product [Caenorhabditis angaria]|uniref:DNA topoisomerase (ATP-hydrolyzing) n=1 Tax=Caenorhabditis angaria TaxID=860376 RepID=A0A9P1IN58_9PELO|nr:unnamed protein product [Caenorhabditis angaria]
MCDESTFLDDSFQPDILTPKAIAMRKIEFICADVKEQRDRGDERIVMRTGLTVDDKCLKYSNKTYLRLEMDLMCLLQIYDLLFNDKKSTKRELFYERKDVYRNQGVADRCLQRLCTLLEETRANLNILSCSKGILRGPVSFLTQSIGIIDGKTQNILLSEELSDCSIINDARFILVIEKESSFQKLLDERFFFFMPDCLLVTGKGYPDICTRLVLKTLVDKLNIPIFGLFDGDPHGIEIFLTYKFGSSKNHSESSDAFIPDIEWIGVFPSDSTRFPIFPDQLLPLSKLDVTKIETLKSRAFQLSEIEICHELEFMRDFGKKIEIEAISGLGNGYLAREIIYPRILDAFSRRTCTNFQF